MQWKCLSTPGVKSFLDKIRVLEVVNLGISATDLGLSHQQINDLFPAVLRQLHARMW